MPDAVRGKSLGEAQLRAAFGVTVVSVKPDGGRYTYTTPESVLAGRLLVAGAKADVERFAASAPRIIEDRPSPG